MLMLMHMELNLNKIQRSEHILHTTYSLKSYHDIWSLALRLA